MPLLKQNLRSRIQSVFEEQIEDVSELASKISDAYNEYAKEALGSAGDRLLLKGSETRLLRTSLLGALKSKSPAPRIAKAIGDGVQAFWMVPPVTSSTGGVVTSIITPPGVIKLQTTKVDSTARAAAQLADALHLMTKTVFLVYPNPIPPGFLK